MRLMFAVTAVAIGFLSGAVLAQHETGAAQALREKARADMAHQEWLSAKILKPSSPTTQPDTVPPEIRAILNKFEEKRAAEEKRVLSELRRTNSEPRSPASRQLAADHLKQLKELREQKGKYVPVITLGDAAKPGDVGRVATLMEVANVVNAHELIVRYSESKNVWIIGIDTAGISDGNAVRFDDPVIVKGTHKYRTVLGSDATILEVQPIDVATYQALLAKEEARAKKK